MRIVVYGYPLVVYRCSFIGYDYPFVCGTSVVLPTPSAGSLQIAQTLPSDLFLFYL